eukprot:jgi/Picsp_1/2989/NSC_01212-R1_origin recognition complex subunit 2
MAPGKRRGKAVLEKQSSEPAHPSTKLLSPRSKLNLIAQRKRQKAEKDSDVHETGEVCEDAPKGRSLRFEPSSCSDDPNQAEGGKDKDKGAVSLPFASASYFSQKKNASSSKSVLELGVSLADESVLRASVEELPERLVEVKKRLVKRYLGQVSEMACQWRAGFSLLFYGYGSKFELLKEIASKSACGCPTMVINALSPNVTIRSILLHVAALGRDCKPNNLSSHSDEDLMGIVREESEYRRLFVFVSNIDAHGLSAPEHQRVLSELASIPRVHFAASIDHVNAPLLWDLQTKDRFAWVWYHVPTFKPYIKECSASAMPSLFLGRKEACTQESALVVLSSLSNNAREVFRCIADAQLQEDGIGGITFQRLFSVCKEKFLASNELILKTFLTEFKDHEILQTRRTTEGADILCVPLQPESLKQLLVEMQMAVDITPFFQKAVVEVARSKGLTDDDLKKLRSSQILRSLGSKTAFSKAAEGVARNIASLKQILKETRAKFGDPTSASDKFLDELEDQITTYVRECKKNIDALQKMCVDGSFNTSGATERAHQQGCVLILAEKLKTAVNQFENLRNSRRYILDKQDMSRRRRKPQAMSQTNRAGETPFSILKRKLNLQEDIHQANGHRIAENTDIHNLQDQSQIQAENHALQMELMSLSDQVQEAERSVREIASLNVAFSAAIFQQAEQIETLYKEAIQATENIDQGNVQLRKTVQVNKSSRKCLFILLFSFSIALLLFDWWYS